MATDASVKRAGDEQKFQATLHKFVIKDPILPVKTAEAQTKRAKAAFATFGTVKVTR